MHILRSEKGRKYFRNTAITFLLCLNMTVVYAATHWEMPEHHPFYNAFPGKKNE
jgi:hypothetical protein